MDYMILNVGLLKEILADVPDEYEVCVESIPDNYEAVVNYDENSELKCFILKGDDV